MSVEVKLENFSVQVKEAIEKNAMTWLNEAAGAIVSMTQRNTPVDTGQLKSSWTYIIDRDKLEATIGSPLENAIWTEFGTGEYALEGNGRKGSWKYQDVKGGWHTTKGKKPQRPLHKSFSALKNKLIKSAKERFENI